MSRASSALCEFRFAEPDREIFRGPVCVVISSGLEHALLARLSHEKAILELQRHSSAVRLPVLMYGRVQMRTLVCWCACVLISETSGPSMLLLSEALDAPSLLFASFSFWTSLFFFFMLKASNWEQSTSQPGSQPGWDQLSWSRSSRSQPPTMTRVQLPDGRMASCSGDHKTDRCDQLLSQEQLFSLFFHRATVWRIIQDLLDRR